MPKNTPQAQLYTCRFTGTVHIPNIKYTTQQNKNSYIVDVSIQVTPKN